LAVLQLFTIIFLFCNRVCFFAGTPFASGDWGQAIRL